MSDKLKIIKTLNKLGEPVSFDNNQLVNYLRNKYEVDEITLDTKGIKVQQFQSLNNYIRTGYFLFKNAGNELCIAIHKVNRTLLDFIKSKDINKISIVTKNNFYQILERDFKAEISYNAISCLSKQGIYKSAKNINYIRTFVGFWVIFFASYFFWINLFYAVNCLLYLLQNMLKAFLFIKAMNHKPKKDTRSIPADLPIYTILIPLYKEEKKVRSILKAIAKLDYPNDKLDVKIIIEEDDKLTLKALSLMNLPSYIHLIKVPYSLPRTKPKALNYAMPFIRGQYLTVYDAEDEPDPSQLKKALTAFSNLPEEYVCVQARLNFYNAKESFLTGCSGLEYSIWFDFLLQGLSIMDLPITLGGTSNHFKVPQLKKIGLWDAYNVTEDADLGLRLALEGYKVGMIDSVTMEEAPNNIRDWLAQRARWIKGFIQTLLVFMYTPKYSSKMNLLKRMVVYIFVGLSSYNFILLPWLFFALNFADHPAIYYLWIINGFFSLYYMYVVAYIAMTGEKATVKLKSIKGFFTWLLWPAYLILHTIAAYRAIWEIITTPFSWNKTPHGGKDEEFVL